MRGVVPHPDHSCTASLYVSRWPGQVFRPTTPLAGLGGHPPLSRGRNFVIASEAKQSSGRRRSDGVDGPRTASMCQSEVVADLNQRRPSVEKYSRIGMDT